MNFNNHLRTEIIWTKWTGNTAKDTAMLIAFLNGTKRLHISGPVSQVMQCKDALGSIDWSTLLHLFSRTTKDAGLSNVYASMMIEPKGVIEVTPSFFMDAIFMMYEDCEEESTLCCAKHLNSDIHHLNKLYINHGLTSPIDMDAMVVDGWKQTH